MDTPQFRLKLLALSTSELIKVSSQAGVGLRTLWKIRAGETATASEKVRSSVVETMRLLRLPRKKKQ